MDLQFGLDTFGDIATDDAGTPLHPAVAIREVLAEGELADRMGLDYFGIGEHHRADYAVSAPDVVLAGLAGRTERIRLGTSVTVLSSDDPIRVFQRFATLDAISGGRAELTVGRGSFVESFALFGLDLADYEKLFSEKLDLLATVLQEEQPVRWSGTIRPPVDGVVQPRTESGNLPAWVGVGGTPASVIRAAEYGLPVVVAVIGGPAERFVPLVQLYRRALHEVGREELPVAVHSPGHVAATDEQARAEFVPPFLETMNRIGRERRWAPMTESDVLQEIDHGAVYCGSPETVAQKIATTVRQLGASRFQLKYSVGTLPHARRLEGIRLYAEEVAPLARDLLA